MKRLALLLSPLALAGAACVAVPVAEGPAPVAYPAPPPAPPPVYPAPTRAPIEAWYGGEHFVPDAYGGGWCYEGRPHRHDFYPDQPDAYVLEGGYYYYRGPLAFTYYEGHPVPGGGWCYARGPHRHEFLPPRGSDFSWRRDRGYVYQGSWRPHRPPPATYWPRVPARTAPVPAPAPYPSRAVPAPAPYPSRAVPAPAPEYRGYPVRPAPAPAPRHDERDRREAAPGHGNLPPGHGGTPPGQVTAPPAGRDRRDDRSGPGRSDRAPGHANLPPGQGGLPPGQAKRAEAAPAPSAPAAVPSAPAAPAPAASAPAPARRSAPAPDRSAPTRQRGDRGDDEETDGVRPSRQAPTR